MARIIQRMELFGGSEIMPPCDCSFFDNPTIQHLDTSLISLLQGTDETGKVNNFTYSEDAVTKVYRDDMEIETNTEHEMAYFDGLAANVVENAAVSEVSETAAAAPSEPAAAAPSEPEK